MGKGQTGYSHPIPTAGIGGSPVLRCSPTVCHFDRGSGNPRVKMARYPIRFCRSPGWWATPGRIESLHLKEYMRISAPVILLGLAISFHAEQIAPAGQSTPARDSLVVPSYSQRNAEKYKGAPRCANFTGVWQVPENDLAPMVLSQGRGCTLSGAFHSRGPGPVDYSVSGTAYASGAVVTVRRTDAGGCETRMFGTLSSLPDGSMTYAISGTTGSCDLPVDFQQTRLWLRQ